MIRTQEATGKTVDEARINACALLGVEKDEIGRASCRERVFRAV